MTDLTDPAGLPLDEHGFVDMDQVPDVDPDAALDPGDVADLQAGLASVPSDVVDLDDWTAMLETATGPDAPPVDGALVPEDPAPVALEDLDTDDVESSFGGGEPVVDEDPDLGFGEGAGLGSEPDDVVWGGDEDDVGEAGEGGLEPEPDDVPDV